MQLQMSREHKKELFKTKYVLNAHLVLTSEEQALIKQHKLGKFELFNAADEWGSQHVFIVTAGGYITKGANFDCESVNHLAMLEDRLTENCKRLSGQLKSLVGAFDGDSRTISFDDE